MHVQFACPSIGPKTYVAVNTSSGWPEIYKRREADAKLAIFLVPVSIEEVLSNFLNQQYATRSKHPRHKTSWGDVTEYLSRLKGISTEAITGEVGVAFWARSLLRELDDCAATAGTN